ncbi:hypothetical protein KIN20_017132 [Parelaphostrongylus tenuis]|uniref:Uncharacterized protein n=1 Tax=Parelaphostrongylus tenuis TaxID=148309 RepID=A0AAD5N2R3_PARTN|nr:hypothetical protein KIN20_017132 [Parelaphostrongylus tenuis]
MNRMKLCVAEIVHFVDSERTRESVVQRPVEPAILPARASPSANTQPHRRRYEWNSMHSASSEELMNARVYRLIYGKNPETLQEDDTLQLVLPCAIKAKRNSAHFGRVSSYPTLR